MNTPDATTQSCASNLAVSNLGAGVVVDLTAQSATGSGNDTLKSIENIIGSDVRDTLIGSIDINTINLIKNLSFVPDWIKEVIE